MSYISEIINNKDKLIRKFADMEIETNIGIIKCYYLLFTKEGIKYNIGSYVLLSIIFIELIITIYFFAKGYNRFKNDIKNIIITDEENQNELNKKNLNKGIKRKK